MRKVVNASDPLAIIDTKARNCVDIHGRQYGPSFAGFDGKLPPLPGWPRNPVTPSDANFTDLRREKDGYCNVVGIGVGAESGAASRRVEAAGRAEPGGRLGGHVSGMSGETSERRNI